MTLKGEKMGRPPKVKSEEVNIQSMIEQVVEAVASPLIEETVDRVYLQSDPEWSDHVLGSLADDEVDAKGNPTVDGLRRMVLKFLGPILSEETNVAATACQETNHRASVVVKVSFMDNNLLAENGNAFIRMSTGAADACGSPDLMLVNIKGEPFRRFPTSIAETRAYGRAYKRALGLRKIVTAEELMSPDDAVENPITSTQVNNLDVMCKRLDINVLGLMSLGREKYTDIKKVPRTKGAHWMSLLGDYERGTAEEKVRVGLDGVKGYSNEWRI